MGQKVNPIGIRLGIIRNWTSEWYANKENYSNYLITDLKVREHLNKKLAKAAVSSIIIKRSAKNAVIDIHSARPGIIIGKRGGDVESLRKEVTNIMGVPVHININEVKKPDIDARLVAESIAQQLERRMMFRRAMKRAVTNGLRAGAQGIRITVSGRLGGSEIARTEWYREGRVPLHTFRADIDYGTAEAYTTYGVIGVKVWIFKGEILGPVKQAESTEETVK